MVEEVRFPNPPRQVVLVGAGQEPVRHTPVGSETESVVSGHPVTVWTVCLKSAAKKMKLSCQWWPASRQSVFPPGLSEPGLNWWTFGICSR